MTEERSVALKVVSYYENANGALIPFSRNEVLLNSVEAALRWVKSQYAVHNCRLSITDDDRVWQIMVVVEASSAPHYTVKNWKQIDIITLEERKHIAFSKSLWDKIAKEE